MTVIEQYDSDHTALVHVLWAANIKGADADELAARIMQSKWMIAVRQHAAEGTVRERDRALADRVRLVGEVERLRFQVAALENDGMELAAKLGEAEEQIARLAASGRQ